MTKFQKYLFNFLQPSEKLSFLQSQVFFERTEGSESSTKTVRSIYFLLTLNISASFQATQSDMEDYLDDYEDDQVLVFLTLLLSSVSSDSNQGLRLRASDFICFLDSKSFQEVPVLVSDLVSWVSIRKIFLVQAYSTPF